MKVEQIDGVGRGATVAFILSVPSFAATSQEMVDAVREVGYALYAMRADGTRVR